MSCVLCSSDGGHVVLRTDKFRIVRVEGEEAARFPGFYRLIWSAHVAEFSDLGREDRLLCMDAVAALEADAAAAAPAHQDQLASLGNGAASALACDPALGGRQPLPAPIWAAAARSVPNRPLDLAVLDAAVAAALG